MAIGLSTMQRFTLDSIEQLGWVVDKVLNQKQRSHCRALEGMGLVTIDRDDLGSKIWCMNYDGDDG
ncbi:MAG: hypothetical protein HOC23_21875 [Halieaceae bacterium]|jgi:hypothetical protein|nr:hypothetical protein [Halieaceae bacterium]